MPPKPLIVLDPGHGSYTGARDRRFDDPGTSVVINGTTVTEAQAALLAAQYLQTRLEAQGFDVLLTRNSDTVLPNRFQARLETGLADKVFHISLHFDAANQGGPQAYYYQSNGEYSRPVVQQPLTVGFANALASAINTGSRAESHPTSLLQPNNFLSQSRPDGRSYDTNYWSITGGGLRNTPASLIELGNINQRGLFVVRDGVVSLGPTAISRLDAIADATTDFYQANEQALIENVAARPNFATAYLRGYSPPSEETSRLAEVERFRTNRGEPPIFSTGNAGSGLQGVSQSELPPNAPVHPTHVNELNSLIRNPTDANGLSLANLIVNAAGANPNGPGGSGLLAGQGRVFIKGVTVDETLTRDEIKAFQRAVGLQDDGIIGQNTIAALTLAAAQVSGGQLQGIDVNEINNQLIAQGRRVVTDLTP